MGPEVTRRCAYYRTVPRSGYAVNILSAMGYGAQASLSLVNHGVVEVRMSLLCCVIALLAGSLKRSWKVMLAV